MVKKNIKVFETFEDFKNRDKSSEDKAYAILDEIVNFTKGKNRTELRAFKKPSKYHNNREYYQINDYFVYIDDTKLTVENSVEDDSDLIEIYFKTDEEDDLIITETSYGDGTNQYELYDTNKLIEVLSHLLTFL